MWFGLIIWFLEVKQAEYEKSAISICAKNSYGMKFYVELIIMCSYGNFCWYSLYCSGSYTVLVTFARNEEKNWNRWTPYLVGKVWKNDMEKTAKVCTREFHKALTWTYLIPYLRTEIAWKPHWETQSSNRNRQISPSHVEESFDSSRIRDKQEIYVKAFQSIV